MTARPRAHGFSDHATERTSDVSILSSTHGRERRQQRQILKRDLQSAMKYAPTLGEVTTGHPDPRTGAARWLYKYNGVVYVTDGLREITSWLEPLVIDPEPITPSMQFKHDAAKSMLSRRANWTSHTVIVVDQSGSMRTGDVVGTGDRRNDTVWDTLLLDFVADRLEKNKASSTDVVSVVGMGRESSLLVDCAPMDWLLYNRLIELRSAKPKGPGNYCPALACAEECLRKNTCGRCALLLLFLSDGRPSDKVPAGGDGFLSIREKHRKMCAEFVSSIASMYGRRLTFGAIGFGPATEDFSVLRDMAVAVEDFGAKGDFSMPSLSSESLATSITALSRSLSTTKTELTDTSGKRHQEVKAVRRDRLNAPDEEQLSSEWKLFDYEEGGVRSVRTSQPSAGILDGRLEWHERMTEPYMLEHASWIDAGAVDVRARGAALRIPIAGEGAERIVHKFREVGASGAFVGPKLVAKESRFVDDDAPSGRLKFHESFARTQLKASHLAQEFNKALAELETRGAMEWGSVPRVEFLDVSVYTVINEETGNEQGYLVEKQLAGKWRKWNSNNGWGFGREPPNTSETAKDESLAAPTGRLNTINEGEEVEGWSDEEEEDDDQAEALACQLSSLDLSHCQIAVDSIPQTFSHFTWHFTKRRMMVCDLQGVFSNDDPIPKFELTDPAIHHRASSKRGAGRSERYGATNKGEPGMLKFFETHECTELCRALKLSVPSKKKLRGRAKVQLPVPLGASLPKPHGRVSSSVMRPASPWEDDKIS